MGEDVFTFHDGTEVAVVARPAAANEPLVMRFTLPDGCGSPPPHIHPNGTETFAVDEGSIELLAGRDWRRLETGETFTVPAGERHTYRNVSGSVAVVRDTHNPHHDFEPYLRVVAALSHEHAAMEPNSPRSAAQFALLLSRHRDLIEPADPPLRAATRLMGPIARVLRVSLPDTI